MFKPLVQIQRTSKQAYHQGPKNQIWRGLSFHLLLPILAILCLCQSCLVVDNPYNGLPPGPWRAVLKLELNTVIPNPKGEPLPEKVNMQIEEIAGGELPFNFEIIYPNPDSFYLEIINGSERIPVTDITIRRDRSTAKDSVFIHFPVFNSTIKGIFVENVIEGVWIDHNRANYQIPFVAYHGRDYRFTKLRKTPTTDVSGKWEVTFLGGKDEEPYKAIGVFEQEENQVTGTFVTETGDYRFLEGTVQEDRLYLSVFDGAHAFLFGARINKDETIDGFFLSGSHYKTLWEAKRNPNFELRDATSLTSLKDEQAPFRFSFENPDGKMVSLEDEQYEGKVKIIQIFGTWCPNCRDETEFLVDYLANNSNQDLAVIGLAFEKQRDKVDAMAALKRYKDKFGMDYELLLAGATHIKAEASQILPMLNKVISYPTMIFLDRNNQVRRIHTGFNGPATDKYPAFKADFQEFVDKLLAEETL